MELTSKTKRIIGIAAVLLLLFLVFLLPYGKAWILTARHGDEFKGAEYVSWIDPEEVCDCKVYSYSAKKKAKVLLVLGESASAAG